LAGSVATLSVRETTSIAMTKLGKRQQKFVGSNFGLQSLLNNLMCSMAGVRCLNHDMPFCAKA
jgi:hypothetical protein